MPLLALSVRLGANLVIDILVELKTRQTFSLSQDGVETYG